MFAGDIACAPTVAKAADYTRRTVIKRRTIRHFLRQSFIDATPDHFGKRQAAIASLRPQAARLLISEVNLCSNHSSIVSTS